MRQFTAIADQWWDEGGKFRPLHQLNPARIEFLRDTLCAHFGRNNGERLPLRGLTVLDVGCGGGLLCEPLTRLGAEVTGIDASKETVAVAIHHADQSGLSINYLHSTPERLVQEHHQYDAVVSLEVIEHVTDVDAFLKALSELVIPSGCLILGTINRTLKSLALAKVAAEYILRWVPVGTHDWNRFVRPSELSRGLKRYGYGIDDITGVSYNPANGTWVLGDDTAVNYMARFSGIRKRG